MKIILLCESLLNKLLPSTALAICLCACGALPANGADSWQEEVILQDGNRLIVGRTVERGGRREVGQSPPIKEQNLSFVHPQTGERIVWEDKPTPDIGGANFLPMLLNIDKGVPYLVAYPMGCLAYNKWGRPNPPYVVFKRGQAAWQTVGLDELPLSLATPNLIFSSPDETAQKMGSSVVSAQAIRGLVEVARVPEYRTILRARIQDPAPNCGEMFGNGKGLWQGAAFFTDYPDLPSCQGYCKREKYDDSTCPCKKLLERK